jgi:hypothetical protein
MSMTHGTIAALFTSRLEPARFVEEENSVDRGHRIEMEAWSLSRMAARLVRWPRMTAKADPEAELQAAVKRLAELSPHLLIDVGIDPETGAVAEEGVALVAARPIRTVAPLPVPVEMPGVVAARPSRLRLQIRVLSPDADLARPATV